MSKQGIASCILEQQ